MKTKIRIVFLSLVLAVSQPALAQRALLDDSPSPRHVYSLDLGWQPHEVMQAVQLLLSDQNAAVPPLTGHLPGVDLRLDTRRYIGRDVRIFLRLPTAIPGTDGIGDIELSWQSDGQLQNGSVSPGQEALIFEGRIEGPVTGGVLNFRLAIGAGGEQDRFSVEPVYEIEVIS